MDDEMYIKCDFRQLPGPKFYTSIVRGRVSNKNIKIKNIFIIKFKFLRLK